MNKTFFLLVICILLSISKVKNETYEWNNGVYSNIDCNNEWTPTSSGYCWSPYGFPSNAQITVPSGFNLTITVELNYTGSGNGFETLYDNYNYGPSHAFPVESFIVQENAFLQINSFVALIVSSDSQISAGGSLLVNGKLAALDGKGNVSVYGNLTISGGNVEGSGLLEVMKGGVLYLDRADDGQENYLLRNTTVQQGASLLQSSGVTHTGFWWADGPVTIDVYGNISLSGYFYDWEQSGFLNIQKGGYFQPTTEQMRGISLSNYGTLDFSNLYYYSPVFTLTHYLNNYALVRNDKVIALTEYAVNRITNYQGVFHALDDLTIQNTLVDYQGTYVADETTITLAEGFINQYPVGYYGGLYGEEPFYEPYYGYINLNGTSLLGSGNVLIYGPISVYENLFIGCYTQLEMEIYSPNFYTQGNFTVASAVVFEIFGGGNLFVASPPKGISPINYFINVNGNLELNGITSNLIIKVFNGGLVSATSQNIFIAPPIQNPSNSLQSNEIWGKFSISGNYTSEISFFLYPGGSLVLEEGSYLDLIGGASLFMCGGDFEENGRLNGSYQSCPNSQIELRDRRLEMEKEKYLLFDQKMENLRSLLSSYDISL